MEQNFQTSFIPKKPMVAERATPTKSTSLLTVVAIFILFTVLLGTTALYFYKVSLNKSIASMENTLELAKNRFEPAKIAELKVLDKRLRASTEVLSHHMAVSPIFQALSESTMKTVRYTKFNYGVGDKGKIVVKISGLAVGYRSVALQSDLLAKNKNFLDPVFSNLTLDDKGNVLFDLEFSVDPSFVDYKQMIKTQS